MVGRGLQGRVPQALLQEVRSGRHGAHAAGPGPRCFAGSQASGHAHIHCGEVVGWAVRPGGLWAARILQSIGSFVSQPGGMSAMGCGWAVVWWDVCNGLWLGGGLRCAVGWGCVGFSQVAGTRLWLGGGLRCAVG